MQPSTQRGAVNVAVLRVALVHRLAHDHTPRINAPLLDLKDTRPGEVDAVRVRLRPDGLLSTVAGLVVVLHEEGINDGRPGCEPHGCVATRRERPVVRVGLADLAEVWALHEVTTWKQTNA